MKRVWTLCHGTTSKLVGRSAVMVAQVLNHLYTGLYAFCSRGPHTINKIGLTFRISIQHGKDFMDLGHKDGVIMGIYRIIVRKYTMMTSGMHASSNL